MINSENHGIHIALIYLSSSLTAHLTIPGQIWQFGRGEDTTRTQNKRNASDRETFLSAYLKCSLLFSSTLKTLKSLYKYLKHLLSGPNAPLLIRSTHNLGIHQASYYAMLNYNMYNFVPCSSIKGP